MTATVYPASLPAKGAGFRYQAWCFDHEDGINCKTRAAAKKWCDAHNEKDHA